MNTLKYVFTTFALLILTINSFAQDCSTSWLYTYPENGNHFYPVGFATNKYAYAIGGDYAAPANYNYALINIDGSLSQWTTVIASSDALGWAQQGGILVGNHVYIAGGWYPGRTADSRGWESSGGEPSRNQRRRG